MARLILARRETHPSSARENPPIRKPNRFFLLQPGAFFGKFILSTGPYRLEA
jgi:hypothetical protein